MGDHHLALQTSAFSLGNTQLQLDPAIEAEIRKLAIGEVSPRLRNLFLHPDWNEVKEIDLERMLRQSSTTDESLPWKRKSADPRPGEMRDVLRAIWAIPMVKAGVDDILDRTACTTRRICSSGAGSAPVSPATAKVVITGAAITSALAFSPTRGPALNFLDRADLGVPGVPGFSVHVRKTGGGGAGAKLENIANTGVTVSGGASMPNESTPGRYDVRLMFDATRIFPIFK